MAHQAVVLNGSRAPNQHHRSQPIRIGNFPLKFEYSRQVLSIFIEHLYLNFPILFSMRFDLQLFLLKKLKRFENECKMNGKSI